MTKQHGMTGKRNAAKPATRSKFVKFRVTDAEELKLNELAEQANQSVSKFILSRLNLFVDTN